MICTRFIRHLSLFLAAAGWAATALSAPQYTDKENALNLAEALDKGIYRNHLITSTFVQSVGKGRFFVKVILDNGGEHNWDLHQIRSRSQSEALVLRNNRALLFPSDGSNDFVTLDKTLFSRTALRARVYTKYYKNSDVLAGQQINFGIHRVKTEYVLLLDDDTRIGATQIPTGLLADHDAVAFNVVPDRRDRHGPQGSNILSCIQRYEYCKSMEIGRRFQDGTASISCVSGAIGLFKTERLRRHHHLHRGAFEGEDLERTLLEHLSHGEVVFTDERVWTVVPDAPLTLLKQRLLNWYPAHYHMFPNFWKLLLRPEVRAHLRYEMAYNIFVVLFEPLRVYSLLYLIVGLRAAELGILYLLYLLLEVYPFAMIRKSIDTGKRLAVLLLYPIYNLCNMILRQVALFVWFWKRFVTREMKRKTEKDRKWWLAPNQ